MKIIDKIVTAGSLYPGLKKYFYNTAWMFAEKCLRLVAGLLVGAIVARHLGPDQFGILNYAISLVTLFTALSTLGLEQMLVRELIKKTGDENLLVGTSFVLRIAGTVVLLFLLTCIIWSVETNHQASTLVYFILLGIFFDAFGVIDYYFQSKVKSKYVVLSQMVSLGCLSIFRIILVLNDAPLEWFALAYAFDFMILSVGLIYFYSREASIFSWRFNYHVAKNLLKHSWPLIISSLAIGFYMKIDQVMVNHLIGNEASGNYGVAVRLSELWYFIPIAICGSLFPSIVNSKLLDKALYEQRLQMLYDLMVAISILVAIPMTFLSGFIVETLYGEAYKDAGPILAIYIWSGVFVFLSVAVSKTLINENLQIIQMASTALSAVINVILNFILIEKLGLAGAALSTLISYSFSAYFGLLFSKRTYFIFKAASRSLNLISLARRMKSVQKYWK